MGKINHFTIVYASETRVYSPNQTVHGSVIIDLKEPMKARSVNLHVVGKAFTHWTCHQHTTTYYDSLSKTTKTKNESHPIRGTEVYMDNKYVLWDGADQKILPMGVHKFDFCFPIPYHCAHSYEGCTGYIRYYCKAKIDRPWQFDKTVMSGFTVLPHFDLNLVPNAGMPMAKENSKNLGLLFKHGRLNTKAILPKSGYVPGEFIDINMDFVNDSSRKVDFIEVKLVEYASFEGRCARGHSAKKTTDRDVAKKRQDSKILAKTSGAELLRLKVPAIVPSFNNCSVIQVQYALKIKVEASGFGNNSITFDFPIIIGTYPLMNRQNGPPALYPPCPGPSSPPEYIQPPQPTAPPTEIYGLPPSYAECMFGQGTMVLDDDDTKTSDPIGFAPRYLVYNDVQAPTSGNIMPSAPPE